MIQVLPGKLGSYSNVVCGTTMRFGGISKRKFSELNLGDHVGDSISKVTYNRALLLSFLEAKYGKFKAFCYLKQAHTNNLMCLDDTSEAEDTNDAVWTTQSQTPLVIMTADCLPVMLTDGDKICAVHAGWKGLENDLLKKSLSIFPEMSKVVAWIGPHITQSNYEIGNDIKERFYDFPEAFRPSQNRDKYLLNLTMVATKRLQKLGVETINCSSTCTYDDRRFFSYRRSIHQGYKSTGRMVTFIIKKK